MMFFYILGRYAVWRSIVVRPPVLAVERFLSCATRLMAVTYCWLALSVPVTAQGCVCRLGGDLNNGLAAQFQ